jgi:hypothetical protein
METVGVCSAQVTTFGPFRVPGTARIETNAKPAPSSVKTYDRLRRRHLLQREKPLRPSMAALFHIAKWQLDATADARLLTNT